MSRHLLFVLFLLLFGGYPVFGQCSGSLYFKDGDGDGFGTELFDSTNTHLVEINFMTAGDGKTVYIGNVAFGCSTPFGYAPQPHDCDDTDGDVWQTSVWYTDEDGDGAYGTYNSGCQQPPPNSSPTRNDCDDGNKNVKTVNTWYIDGDNDGAYGTLMSGCQLPPADSSPTANDWVML